VCWMSLSEDFLDPLCRRALKEGSGGCRHSPGLGKSTGITQTPKDSWGGVCVSATHTVCGGGSMVQVTVLEAKWDWWWWFPKQLLVDIYIWGNRDRRPCHGTTGCAQPSKVVQPSHFFYYPNTLVVLVW